ncbi:unnamed protein product [Pleuronectes platessa]|uniref:Uncharacterized protein n=1 Tax=Pleuronectes platessa TaxID=8262 RepID=A0A9N7W213_PLEPL|nr:unnamed protein product [Pleuronectes platessa]
MASFTHLTSCLLWSVVDKQDSGPLNRSRRWCSRAHEREEEEEGESGGEAGRRRRRRRSRRAASCATVNRRWSSDTAGRPAPTPPRKLTSITFSLPDAADASPGVSLRRSPALTESSREYKVKLSLRLAREGRFQLWNEIRAPGPEWLPTLNTWNYTCSDNISHNRQSNSLNSPVHLLNLV